ncbi:MAG: histidine kinase dimerization/phospho-acceptor domain-containing protein [Spirochaetota bacterium]
MPKAMILEHIWDFYFEPQTNLKGTLETVAHDIRTPMTRIRTRAEVALRQHNDPEQMSSTLQTIVKAVAQAHKGSVTVADREKGASEFIITLPKEDCE